MNVTMQALEENDLGRAYDLLQGICPNPARKICAASSGVIFGNSARGDPGSDSPTP